MRAAIYTRVSTREQDQENQLAELRSFAERAGYELVATYTDTESGSRSDRPQFRRMMLDARWRRFDVLLFWSLDRFTREGATKTLQYLTELDSYGVRFQSFTEQYLDSTGIFREAVISILAVIAKQERIRISERTRAGLERARRQGKQIGRPRRVLDVVKIRECWAQGMSLAAIGRRFGVSAATISRRLQTASANSAAPPIASAATSTPSSPATPSGRPGAGTPAGHAKGPAARD